MLHPVRRIAQQVAWLWVADRSRGVRLTNLAPGFQRNAARRFGDLVSQFDNFRLCPMSVFQNKLQLLFDPFIQFGALSLASGVDACIRSSTYIAHKSSRCVASAASHPLNSAEAVFLLLGNDG